jgi:hypothetical protein
MEMLRSCRCELADFLVNLFGRRSFADTHSITLEKELQEEEQVTGIHHQCTLNVSHVSPTPFGSNVLQRGESQEDTYNHLF